MADIVGIVFVFGGFFSFLLAISPVGRAIADRIRQGGPLGSPEGAARLDEVLAEVDLVREELSEMQERLDFVERMIARERREELPPPRGNPENQSDVVPK